MYLSDVEEGGSTHFPHVIPDNTNFAVEPKKGRAVLWPSVYTDRLEEKDERTTHQALPVTKGTKYGANAFIHLRDYMKHQARGCTW